MTDEIFNMFPKEKIIEITLSEWKQICRNKIRYENLVIGYRFLFTLFDSEYRKKNMRIGDKAVFVEIIKHDADGRPTFTDFLAVIIPEEKGI